MYSILKFGHHIKTSQHRRKVSEVYGKNSTLVDLQMKQTPVRRSLSTPITIERGGRGGGGESVTVDILPPQDDSQEGKRCVYRQVHFIGLLVIGFYGQILIKVAK